EAVRRHLVDHPVATLDCALFVSIRMVVRRTLRQGGQVSGFGNGEVVDRFVEIAECSASNTEGAHAEPNFVEIKLENTVFRIGLLDAEREDHFSQLALDGLISCQEEVLGDLLGNRRGANKAASSAKILEISDNRTGKTRHVDAWMTIKVFVLSREKRRFYAIR